MYSKKEIKAGIESMLFVWGEPLSVNVIAEIFNVEWRTIYEYLRELKEEYQSSGKGILIREVNKTFFFATAPENAEIIDKLCNPTKGKRLSQSALEVLAIVAYKQPVTRGEIESIRGIKCTRVLDGLIQKEMIEEVGRSDAIGRPILYGTTKTFLRTFGFEHINQLPEIEELANWNFADEEDSSNDESEQLSIKI